ncbi:hypothetical protein K440DRAFT_638861 [Wilcoxina mikolae CBS 423.85]|nr:hypothetical protein K440DRAFT_638861 [Wilcoxina mikolae CBS 423.85]
MSQPAEPKTTGTSIHSIDISSIRFTGRQKKLIPVPTEEAKEHGLKPLTFRPFAISTEGLLLLAFFFVICIGGLSVLLVASRRNNGLVDQRAASELSPTAFAIRFLPPAVGTFSTLAMATVLSEVARLTPYITMASTTNDIPYRSIFAPYFPYGLNFDDVRRRRHFTLFTLQLAAVFFQGFVTPLKSILFTQISSASSKKPQSALGKLLADNSQAQGQRVHVANVVAVILILIYSVGALGLCLTAFRLRNKETGLRWDVDSIADMIVLIRHSNGLEAFQHLDWKHISRKDFLNLLHNHGQRLRLGYWRTVDEPRTYIHTIGIRTERPEQEQAHTPVPDPNPSQYRDLFSKDSDRDRKRYRYAKCPWYETRRARVILSIFFIAVLVALILALRRGVVETGFSPRASMEPIRIHGISIGITPAGLLWSFFPVFIAAIVSRLWIVIDLFFRITQPFVSLSRPTLPEYSILLNYPTMPPAYITIKACMNGHWKLAWVSAVGLLTRLLPVLVGGVFTVEDKHQAGVYRLYPQKTAFIFIISLFVLYSITCIMLWLPGTSRKMPRNLFNIADTISLLHRSKMLDDPEFADLSSKEDLAAKLRLSRHLYAYGFTVDNHLTVDRAERLDLDCLQESNSKKGFISGLKKRIHRARWVKPDPKLP